jgi:hypothetical protein
MPLFSWPTRNGIQNAIFWVVERLWGRLRKLDRKGRRVGLTNLRGVRLEAGYFWNGCCRRTRCPPCMFTFPIRGRKRNIGDTADQ